MTKEQIQKESLSRATGNSSMSNYPAIFAGFMEKGIAEDAIIPRENVFTYNAWRALKRQVRKGEKGVKITTWVSMDKKVENDDGETENKSYKRPKNTTVFHISQTDAMEKPKCDIEKIRDEFDK